MHHFFIGDIVRIAAKDELSGKKKLYAGQICTIERRGHIDGNYFVKENPLVWDRSELELIKQIEDIKTFEVGDIVVVTASGLPQGKKSSFIGNVYRIADMHRDEKTRRVTYGVSPYNGFIWRAGELDRFFYDTNGIEALL